MGMSLSKIENYYSLRKCAIEEKAFSSLRESCICGSAKSRLIFLSPMLAIASKQFSQNAIQKLCILYTELHLWNEYVYLDLKLGVPPRSQEERALTPDRIQVKMPFIMGTQAKYKEEISYWGERTSEKGCAGNDYFSYPNLWLLFLHYDFLPLHPVSVKFECISELELVIIHGW